MTAKSVDASPRPALWTVCRLLAPFTTSLLVKSYTVPYFKLAYIFSV